MKRALSAILSLAFGFSVLLSSYSAYAANNQNKQSNVITEAQRNKFYKHSAFVGNSIGLGQQYYFRRQGKGYLGNPVMLVKGSYSFYNDRKALTKWMIHYKGKPMRAKNAIKASGVKRVFISMGANDFYYGADRVFEDYVQYIKGIRKVNPEVVIFIESTTGVAASRQGRNLNSKNVKKLNELMEAYCKKRKDMYFVDVSSKMLDKNGHLKRKYASDNYVHLTDSAYKLWTKELIKYTDKLMQREKRAKQAVRAAEKSKTKQSFDFAKKKLELLEKSTLKQKLIKRLNNIVINEEGVTNEKEN